MCIFSSFFLICCILCCHFHLNSTNLSYSRRQSYGINGVMRGNIHAQFEEKRFYSLYLYDIFRRAWQLDNTRKQINVCRNASTGHSLDSLLLSILVNQNKQTCNKHILFTSNNVTDYLILVDESEHTGCKFYNIADSCLMGIICCLFIFALNIDKGPQQKPLFRKLPFQFPIPKQKSIIVYPFSLNQYAKEMVTEQRSEEELMKFEWPRYISFKTFPVSSIMMPMRLAQAGFYYTGHGEKVKCFCCGITNSEWSTEENALQVHLRLSPNCDFIRNNTTNNVPIHFQEYYNSMFQGIQPAIRTGEIPAATGGPSDSVNSACGNDGIRNSSANLAKPTNKQPNNGIQKAPEGISDETSTVKHPDYADEAKREDSFQNWTLHEIQSPKTLASAGFFYTGIRDFVRCYCCNVGLKNWQKGDNPVTEHLRWSPTCLYLKYNKTGNNSANREQQLTETNSMRPCSQQSERAEGNPGLNQSGIKEGARALQEENKRLRQQMMCKGCLANSADTVFLPCGHMITCQSCAVKQKMCIQCNQQIKGTVRVYQS